MGQRAGLVTLSPGGRGFWAFPEPAGRGVSSSNRLVRPLAGSGGVRVGDKLMPLCTNRKLIWAGAGLRPSCCPPACSINTDPALLPGITIYSADSMATPPVGSVGEGTALGAGARRGCLDARSFFGCTWHCWTRSCAESSPPSQPGLCVWAPQAIPNLSCTPSS